MNFVGLVNIVYILLGTAIKNTTKLVCLLNSEVSHSD